MIIVPGRTEEPIVTRHSRELGRRVEQLVRDYKRENPELRDEEVRSALMHSMMESTDVDALQRRRKLAIMASGLAVAVAGVAAAMAGRGGETNPSVWVVFAAVCAIAGIAIALRRLNRRY
jgi:hypothetical protein